MTTEDLIRCIKAATVSMTVMQSTGDDAFPLAAEPVEISYIDAKLLLEEVRNVGYREAYDNE